jgi:hypothetical protein
MSMVNPNLFFIVRYLRVTFKKNLVLMCSLTYLKRYSDLKVGLYYIILCQ